MGVSLGRSHFLQQARFFATLLQLIIMVATSMRGSRCSTHPTKQAWRLHEQTLDTSTQSRTSLVASFTLHTAMPMPCCFHMCLTITWKTRAMMRQTYLALKSIASWPKQLVLQNPYHQSRPPSE